MQKIPLRYTPANIQIIIKYPPRRLPSHSKDIDLKFCGSFQVDEKVGKYLFSTDFDSGNGWRFDQRDDEFTLYSIPDCEGLWGGLPNPPLV